MLRVEELGFLLCKFCHFYIADSKSILLNDIDNFANIHIGIRFNHSKSSTDIGYITFPFVFKRYFE
jgi:hypothetical protein